MGLVGPGGDGQIPASTGIEGRNARGGWCALDLLALQPRAGGRLEMRRLHNRKQNEATEYGSAFARAWRSSLGDAPLRVRLGHGLDRRPRRDRARRGLRGADPLHARGGQALLEGAARASPTSARPRRSSRTPATAGRSSASSSGRASRARPSSRPSPTLPRRPALRDRRHRRRAAASGAGGEDRPRRCLPALLRRAAAAGGPRTRAALPRRWSWRRCRRRALGADALAGGTLRGAGGEGGRLVLVDAAGRRACSPPPSTAPPIPTCPSTGSDPLRRRKAAADPWCVWEMNADGTAARKITCGAAGARQPIYQSTIYTITPTSVEPWVQVAFVGENPGERDEAGSRRTRASGRARWTARRCGG